MKSFVYIYTYVYESFYFVLVKGNLHAWTPSVSVIRAPYGAHMKLHMVVHIELHIELHMELHIEL